MDYILEDLHNPKHKIVITKDQKDILDQLADVDYSATDTKIYIINKHKFYINVIR